MTASYYRSVVINGTIHTVSGKIYIVVYIIRGGVIEHDSRSATVRAGYKTRSYRDHDYACSI